jgi:hypothetical protein
MGNYKRGYTLLQSVIIFGAILLAVILPYDQHFLQEETQIAFG